MSGSQRAKIKSGVTIGSALFMADSGWKDYLLLWPLLKNMDRVNADWFQKLVSPFSLRVNSFWDQLFFHPPNVDSETARRMLSKNWEPMCTSLLGQLKTALDDKGLLSRESESYVAGLPHIQYPLFSVAGSLDKQISAESVKKTAAMVPGSDLLVCGRDSGHAHDYGVCRFSLLLLLQAY
jgi:hypothetical protein